MFSKKEPIIPGVSIGGVCLGKDAQKIVEELKGIGVAISQRPFENLGRSFSEWEIKDWGLSFVQETGRIIRVSCNPIYEGRYKQSFYPGMSVKQIVSASNKQLLIHGMLVVDGEYGAFFDVPEIYEGKPYDDIDTTSQLPGDMILKQIHVMTHDWWR